MPYTAARACNILYDSFHYAGQWLFLMGSIVFGVRPAMRLLLELRLTNLPVPEEFRPFGEVPARNDPSS